MLSVGLRKNNQRGYTFLLALAAVAILAVTAGTAVELSSQSRRREREEELLFRGRAYRDAIQSYVNAGNGTHPRHLEDLLLDSRALAIKHHLRTLYPEPITGGDWTLVRHADGGIVGVASPSAGEPLKQSGFDHDVASFEGATKYSDWIFQVSNP